MLKVAGGTLEDVAVDLLHHLPMAVSLQLRKLS